MSDRARQVKWAALALVSALACSGVQAFGCSGAPAIQHVSPERLNARTPERPTPEPSSSAWAGWWHSPHRPRTVRQVLLLNGHPVEIFREALLPGWQYPCTNEELEAALRSLPPAWTARLRSVRLTFHPEWDAYARTDRARIEISYIVDAALRAPGDVPDDTPEELQFGARLVREGGQRRLMWPDREALRVYILRHILIHELGHHVAPPGLSRDDEEDWAEAFAYRYYDPSSPRHIIAAR